MAGDTLKKCHGGTLQHGKASDRVYVMDIDPDQAPALFDTVETLVAAHGYSKVFAKVPEQLQSLCEQRGLEVEARVPGMWNGQEAALFMSRFVDPDRARPADPERLKAVLDAAKEKSAPKTGVALPDGYTGRAAREEDWATLADLYREVFPSYPFPIHDPDYLRRTAEDNIDYFVVEDAEGRMVAAASTERDAHGAAEMTDFATLPEMRGAGLAQWLLAHMEQRAPESGVRTAFTIARAVSFGMNITFSRAGYTFAGALVNNTQISGGLETMNVWYKPLQ